MELMFLTLDNGDLALPGDWDGIDKNYIPPLTEEEQNEFKELSARAEALAADIKTERGTEEDIPFAEIQELLGEVDGPRLAKLFGQSIAHSTYQGRVKYMKSMVEAAKENARLEAKIDDLDSYLDKQKKLKATLARRRKSKEASKARKRQAKRK
jgi:hypothetical protein